MAMSGINFVMGRYTKEIVEGSLSQIKSCVEQYMDDNAIIDVDGKKIPAMIIKSVSKFKILGIDSMKQTAIDQKNLMDMWGVVSKMPQPIVQDENGKHYPISTKKILEDLIKSDNKMLEGYIGTKAVEDIMPQGMTGVGGGAAPGVVPPTGANGLPPMANAPRQIPTGQGLNPTGGGNPIVNMIQHLMNRGTGGK
jgi:hypothetical protein